MSSDYGIELDGWGDYYDAQQEEREWEEFEAADMKWRLENPELAAAADADYERKRAQDRADAAAYQKTLDDAAASAKRPKKQRRQQAQKQRQAQAQGAANVVVAPVGSVMTSRNTILSPDGWTTVVPRGSVLKTKTK